MPAAHFLNAVLWTAFSEIAARNANKVSIQYSQSQQSQQPREIVLREMEEDQNALALEADAAFERKHGFKPSERSFRAKPYLPNLKQIRAGDITEEYKRHYCCLCPKPPISAALKYLLQIWDQTLEPPNISE